MKAKKPSPIRGLVAGLVVVGLAVGAYCVFFTNDETRQSVAENKGRNRIKEVTPAPAPKAKPKEEQEKPKELPPQRVGEVRNGYRLLCDGRLQKVSPHPIIVDATPSRSGPVFGCHADQLLGDLVQIEPGEAFVGDSAVDYKDFDKQFPEAVLSPIKIEDTDSEYDKQVKQAVIDLKKELVKRLKAGEDIKQLLIETRDQLQELGTYRDELEQEVCRMMHDGEMSDRDKSDLVAAANKMLEDRGSKPLSITKAFEGIMQVEEARRKQKEQGKAE